MSLRLLLLEIKQPKDANHITYSPCSVPPPFSPWEFDVVMGAVPPQLHDRIPLLRACHSLISVAYTLYICIHATKSPQMIVIVDRHCRRIEQGLTFGWEGGVGPLP